MTLADRYLHVQRMLHERDKDLSIRDGMRTQAADSLKLKLIEQAGNAKLLATAKRTSLYLIDQANASRMRVKTEIENVVTEALKYCNGDDYFFEIEFSPSRSNPACNFFIGYTDKITGETLKEEIEDSFGGGFMDICSTVIFLLYRKLFNEPTVLGFTGLDEPGKMVSADVSMRFAEFLKQLAQDIDTQLILSSHSNAIQGAADKMFFVTNTNNNSTVTEV